MGFFQRPTLRTRDDKRTTAAELTLRASIYPLCLVTILFFLWYVWHSVSLHTTHAAHRFTPHFLSFCFVCLLACYHDTRSRRPHRGFSYGLIDTLNKHFQETLGITRARSSGLQAAYFGAYPLASLGHANWLLRHWGYKAVFIWGLCLFGVGALLTWPALVYQSFGGFCAATFVIGNGLGSLETAANPYLTVCEEFT
jgi:FHS family L-fucose permease-like MFS transporter